MSPRDEAPRLLNGHPAREAVGLHDGTEVGIWRRWRGCAATAWRLSAAPASQRGHGSGSSSDTVQTPPQHRPCRRQAATAYLGMKCRTAVTEGATPTVRRVKSGPPRPVKESQP